MRLAFLVDGFNLYHSLDEAAIKTAAGGFKWLDLKKFCTSFLPHIGKHARPGPVHYFSAYARHRLPKDPDVVARHGAYIRCLEDSGVIVEMGHFKRKLTTCPRCNRQVVKHEEKETDVAIGVRLIELLWSRQCDGAAIVSADSDLAPAVRTAKRMFPGSPIYTVQPWNRNSSDLKNLADGHFTASLAGYRSNQFPCPYVCRNRVAQVSKPPTW